MSLFLEFLVCHFGFICGSPSLLCSKIGILSYHILKECIPMIFFIIASSDSLGKRN
jgi:hypothetical protein